MTQITKLLVCVLLATVVGCGSKDDAQPKLDLSNTQLKHVPSDSPYVFAMLEPLPTPVLERFDGMMDEAFSAYKDLFVAAMESEGGMDKLEPEQRELVDYFVGKFTTEEGLKSLGFGAESTFVVYGQGLLPVFRVKLTDGDLMRDFIAEFQVKAEKELPEATVAGQAYWYTPDSEKVQGLMAVMGDELVMTVVPSGASEGLVESVLGVNPPASSLATDGTFTTLMNDYNYVAHGVSGAVDFTKIADVFLGEPTGVNAELLQIMDFDNSNISDICKTEIREMIDVMPRMVTGYSLFSADEMVSDMVLEIRSDLATSLTGLSAPVPGVGTSKSGLFSMGMGFDIPKSIEFAKAQIAAIEADPYECEYFADFQSGLEQMKTTLAQPIPPFVSGVKGFNVVVDELEVDENMQPDPNSIKMRGLVAVDNAPAMWGMATMFSPELAQLGMEPNQEPVEVDAGAIPGFNGSAFVAMAENSIAWSVGNDTGGLSELFSAKTKEHPPVMSVAYDMKAYVDFILRFSEMDMVKNDDDPKKQEIDKAALEAMQRVFTAMEGMLGWTAVDLAFTEQGFKFEQYVALK